jgi:UDP-glucuronate decarboxylase
VRVLVTGGAGFLGSHLCDRLLSDGHEVVCADNFSTGSRRNVYHLLGNPDFELVRHDVTFPLYVEVERIYNLACPASPVHYRRDPVQTVKTCVHGAINVLGLAKRTGARILQASTSEVYGDPEVHPQREDYVGHVDQVGPRACYDEGKRCAETLFREYAVQHGVDVRVVRIFNTYGPRMSRDDGRVVSEFVVSALSRSPMRIHGDGEQTRSFCYVDDMVEGLVGLMECRQNDEFLPVNLGNPDEVTVNQLARLVGGLVGVHGLEHDLAQVGDPRRRRPDVSEARRLIGWEPRVGLEEGLRATIRYFEYLLEEDARG